MNNTQVKNMVDLINYIGKNILWGYNEHDKEFTELMETVNNSDNDTIETAIYFSNEVEGTEYPLEYYLTAWEKIQKEEITENEYIKLQLAIYNDYVDSLNSAINEFIYTYSDYDEVLTELFYNQDLNTTETIKQFIQDYNFCIDMEKMLYYAQKDKGRYFKKTENGKYIMY